ncbi:hypothetical protein OSC52_13415 [Clostridium pasteurianum]|uniref:hypothetical protein n=1 Tax=Clostridium pasteurianum TaxID=1501 RepID=UPI002260B4FE|nr:hypothetical protein [Clostridium pasteurianum]UZW12847.1 hypothetical protein OSC52_13415 [Clostridium pasteurianum]
MSAKKISISFSEAYIEAYNWLRSKNNASNYICQLIMAEMNKKETLTPELESKIEELINKILKESNYSCNTNFKATTTTENIINSLTEDDKSLIKDLF